MNAFLRCGTLRDGINYGQSLLLKKQTHVLDVKYSAVKNVLINFERYWRDYNCDMKRDIGIEINEILLLLSQWKRESNNNDIDNSLKYCWASLLATSLVAGTYETSFHIISSINQLNTGAVTSSILGKNCYCFSVSSLLLSFIIRLSNLFIDRWRLSIVN